VMSLVGLGWRAGAAVGPAAAGFLYDVTGSYQIPFAGALATLLLGGALFAVGARAAEPARAG
jgi:cyanate permease